MTIHNLSRVRWFNLAMGIAFGLPVLLLVFWDQIPLPFQWRASCLTAYLVLLLGAVYISKPAYCSFEVSDRKLVAKYYYLIPLFLMRVQRSTIEILKSDFKNYELVTHNYGLTRELRLNVRQSARVLPYPPVSVVLLSQKTWRGWPLSWKNSTFRPRSLGTFTAHCQIFWRAVCLLEKSGGLEV